MALTQEDLVKQFPGLLDEAMPLEISDGWLELLQDMCMKLYALDKPGRIRLTQVKSKFQLLRVYFTCDDQSLYSIAQDIISEHEVKSAKVCVTCGAEGILTGQAYWAPEASCSLHRK